MDAEQLASMLTLKEYELLLLHGDMDQAERNKVITKFKKQEVNIMVATDVAGKIIILIIIIDFVIIVCNNNILIFNMYKINNNVPYKL